MEQKIVVIVKPGITEEAVHFIERGGAVERALPRPDIPSAEEI